MRLGRFNNLEIYVDLSLFVLMGLLAISFRNYIGGIGIIPLITCVMFAIGVVASIFFHEMAHVTIGRKNYIKFDRIKLWMLGGEARMRNLPPTPRAEFLMAAAGPISSFLLSAVCFIIAGLIATLTESFSNPAVVLISALSSINFILGIFNLLPIFPLDGGRCLRSFLWNRSGSFYSGTKTASNISVYFSYGLMGMGALIALGVSVPFFGSGILSGIWLGFIGWMVKGMAERELKAIR